MPQTYNVTTLINVSWRHWRIQREVRGSKSKPPC